MCASIVVFSVARRALSSVVRPGGPSWRCVGGGLGLGVSWEVVGHVRLGRLGGGGCARVWVLPALRFSSLRALVSPLCSPRSSLPPSSLCFSLFLGGGGLDLWCVWVFRQAGRVSWVAGWLGGVDGVWQVQWAWAGCRVSVLLCGDAAG